MGFESFVERAIVGAELAHAFFERVVLRGNPLDRILCPLGFQIADTPEEFADAIALGQDFGVGGLKRITVCAPFRRPSPSSHRLGHRHVSFEAKRFRHRAIATHQVPVADIVAAGPG